MGLNHLGTKSNVDDLMKVAIDNGFTKNGEMFDSWFNFLELFQQKNLFKSNIFS
jgi:hypothetical protein